MGQYGHTFDKLIDAQIKSQYESKLNDLISVCNDYTFLNILSETSVLTEGVIGDIINKIKELCDKIIDFIKSAFNKIKTLILKHIGKHDSYEKDIQGKEFENKIFDKELYNYGQAAQDLLDEFNELISKYGENYSNSKEEGYYKDLADKIEEQREKNHKYDRKDSISGIRLDQDSMSDFIKKYKYSDTSAKFLIDNKKDFIVMEADIRIVESSLSRSERYFENINKEIFKYRSDSNNENINYRVLYEFEQYIGSIISCCGSYINRMITYETRAVLQYEDINKFLKTCYK